MHMKKLLYLTLLIPVLNAEEDYKNYCYFNERSPMIDAINTLANCPYGNTMFWRANLDSIQNSELAWALCDYKFTVRLGNSSTCIRKKDGGADIANVLFLIDKYSSK